MVLLRKNISQNMKFFILLSLIVVFLTSNGQSSIDRNSRVNDSLLGETQKDIIYSFTIIQTVNNTWCYDIFKEGKRLIHQTSIPGLPGNEGFKNKSDAERVAQLVIEKLKKGEMPPSITADELKKMKIL
jgi:hypothetical protein